METTLTEIYTVLNKESAFHNLRKPYYLSDTSFPLSEELGGDCLWFATYIQGIIKSLWTHVSTQLVRCSVRDNHYAVVVQDKAKHDNSIWLMDVSLRHIRPINLTNHIFKNEHSIESAYPYSFDETTNLYIPSNILVSTSEKEVILGHKGTKHINNNDPFLVTYSFKKALFYCISSHLEQPIPSPSLPRNLHFNYVDEDGTMMYIQHSIANNTLTISHSNSSQLHTFDNAPVWMLKSLEKFLKKHHIALSRFVEVMYSTRNLCLKILEK